MRTPLILSMALLSLPLAAQAWDLRLESPYSKGQGLPWTRLQGSGQAASGDLDTGRGAIFTLSHRIIRVGPILKFEWNAEVAHLRADGRIQQGSAEAPSSLKQTGAGLGANAQFWVPFTGVAGELGLMERVQAYRYEGAGASASHTLARPWMRAGLRWSLPLPGISPYVAASYQWVLTRDRPNASANSANLPSYVGGQGAGQEFQHLWTFGAGISF